jgi:hypothetical protein
MKLLEPTPDAIRHVARGMRDLDREEIFCQRDDDDPDALAAEVLSGWGPYYFVAATPAGEPAAVVGATRLWPGVFSAWMFSTPRVDIINFSLTQFIKTAMIPGVAALGAHRCEALSMASHTVAHRWLEYLGAEREAVLRRYGRNGQDFFVYRWDRADVQVEGSPA